MINPAAHLPKVHYCNKKLGNTSRCSNYATHLSVLTNDVQEDEVYRCEEHKGSRTQNKRVIYSMPFDQRENIRKVDSFLKNLIGRTIKSSAHTAKELVVLYTKPNGGIMCQQPITKKYKFVYYNQIREVY